MLRESTSSIIDWKFAEQYTFCCTLFVNIELWLRRKWNSSTVFTEGKHRKWPLLDSDMRKIRYQSDIIYSVARNMHEKYLYRANDRISIHMTWIITSLWYFQRLIPAGFSFYYRKLVRIMYFSHILTKLLA